MYIIGPIMYHKVVLLDESCILLIGGRKSPHEANGTLYTLHLSSNSGEWRVAERERLSDEVQPRWRHSADIFTFQGTCVAKVSSEHEMPCYGNMVL